MSNDSLPRLFSSKFLNTWMAVSYLFKYSYNDDVIHYLCKALETLPTAEIEYFLPQLMHLLIRKSTLTAALERVLVDLWKRSPHLAVMCFWYLQTYLSDWSSEPTSSPYLLCQRMLNQCQNILRKETIGHHEMDEDELDSMTSERQQQNIKASTWQMGLGQQLWAANNNDDATNQEDSDQKNPNNTEDSNHRTSCILDGAQTGTPLHTVDPFSLSRYLPNHMKWLHHKPFQHMRRAVSSDGALVNEFLDSRKTNVIGTVPFPNTDQNNNEDDLSPHNHLRHSFSSSYLSTFNTQREHCEHPSLPPLEPSSTPSTASSFQSPRPSSPISSNNSSCDNQWSYSGYFEYEMQFLASLSGIAERLVALPKQSRDSALHAELTLLNCSLPTNVCLPLWCSGGCSSPHHRVVRVSPSDAVVLNSAERAPYLLMIEVLDDDLCLEFQGIKGDHENNVLASSGYDNRQTTVAGTIGLGMARSGPMTATFPNTRETVTTMDGISCTDFSRQMRTAAVLLAQLQQQDANDPAQVMVHAIRQRVIDQMVALEEQRIKSLTTVATRNETTKQPKVTLSKKRLNSVSNKSTSSVSKQGFRNMVVNKDDPSAAILSESWQTKTERLRKNSPFGHLPNWRLLSVIVKQGADLRQEQFTLQLIREMQKIWQKAEVDVWVKYYRVLVTSENSGLIETIRNTVSVHSIKKNAYGNKKNGAWYTLRDFFKQRWGPPKSARFKAAQAAFLKSLAGYSVVCYLLQIKDRHNGNLLLDDQGHLIHIDFGFVLSISPGSMGFEKAPFKLSQEYIDVLDGVDGELFDQYRRLMKQAFKALRKHGDTILLLVEIMSKASNLPCFKNNPDRVLLQLKERFQFHLTDHQLDMYVDKLISNSRGNLFTQLYDGYQYYSQGIL